MHEVKNDESLQLQIIVTGMHLAPEFGLTYKQIEADGLQIDYKIEMLLSADSNAGIIKSLGLGVIGFADALGQLKPDIAVILGDRFEILAAAQAALIARIPLAHIHGGETSEGAIDESIRHALTKLAQWHFVAAEPYRQRVVQLGESPDRVYNVGAPGLDHINTAEWMDRQSLAHSLEMDLRNPLFLVTYHPATLGEKRPEEATNELLQALTSFPDADIIFTFPNADTGGRVIIQKINEWVAAHHNAKAFVSLGQKRYLSLLREADLVIGNSSSGIIEAPAFGKATVNIGDRQKGRLRASSVIDAAEERDSIVKAIDYALSKEFQSSLLCIECPYGKGKASLQIKEVLKTVELSTQKSFFNIQHGF